MREASTRAFTGWCVAIEERLRGVLDALGLKPRQGFAAVRVAVTGSLVSPPLFESIALLGRERTLARLATASALASDSASGSAG